MSFAFEAPTSLDEALQLKAEHGDQAVILAGGQSLLILIRQGLVSPEVVITLDRISDLATIEQRDGALVLGAMARYAKVAADLDVARLCPTMARAADSLGSIHIRNRGTIGGALCHADPAGDVPVVALALAAELVVAKQGSTRRVPVDDLFKGLFQTCLEDDEIAVQLVVPPQPDAVSYGYRRYSHRKGEYPMCVSAVRLEWGEDGTCRDARVAVGGAGSRPVRLKELERSLAGTTADPEILRAGLERVQDQLKPLEDVRGGAAWKRRVVTRVLRDSLNDAVAGGLT